MRLLIATGLAVVLSGCTQQSLTADTPVGISRSINGLQRSSCNCGGLESRKENKVREKAKEQAAKEGKINYDIVQDNR